MTLNFTKEQVGRCGGVGFISRAEAVRRKKNARKNNVIVVGYLFVIDVLGGKFRTLRYKVRARRKTWCSVGQTLRDGELRSRTDDCGSKK